MLYSLIHNTGIFPADRLPDSLYLNWETSEGHPYPYFTYGTAVSEVEIDCLTGAHQVSPHSQSDRHLISTVTVKYSAAICVKYMCLFNLIAYIIEISYVYLYKSSKNALKNVSK